MCSLRFVQFWLFLTLSCVIQISLPSESLAQDNQQQVAAELKSVRSRIEREEERLKGVQKRQLAIQNSLEQIEVEFVRIEREKVTLKSNLEEVTARTVELEATIHQGRGLVDKSREALGHRVTAIYKMHRRSGSFVYLFQADSATNLLKRAAYLARITAYDRKKLEEVDTMLNKLEQERQGLERAKKQRAEYLSSLSSLERDLEQKKIDQATLLTEVKDEEKTVVATLSKLESSAQELEAVMAKIMGAEEVPPPAIPTPPEQPVAEDKVQPTPQIVVVPYDGPGLAAARGQLTLPVNGQILERFGRKKHDEFADMLFIKGLEFKADPGTKVVAVAAGKVVLNQILPGYGNVIIIDHGQRYFTLYGRLASGLARLGGTVKKGEAIAVLGEADKKGRNFYFELRIKGKPIDPLTFFKEQQVATQPSTNAG